VTDELVRYEVRDGVALLTLNRADRLNALVPAMRELWHDLLERAAADPQVRAIVVTGAGRAFCSGADIKRLEDAADGTLEPFRDTRPWTFPLTIPKPIIAAINGACAGGGLVQALMCDVRFAAAGAQFTTSFARRGLIAEHGISWLLPRIVGSSRALDLLLSARVVTAEEAAAMGLVDRVLAPAHLLGEALGYAADLARFCSPRAMATIKRQVYSHLTGSLELAVTDSDRLMQASLDSPDLAEGVRSFKERRAPSFDALGGGSWQQ
jgi:enoyl-CoA hydratase/carnithine racemase